MGAISQVVRTRPGDKFQRRTKEEHRAHKLELMRKQAEEVRAINDAAPKPLPNGESSMVLAWHPFSLEWMIVVSCNRAYIELVKTRCKPDTPAIPLHAYTFSVSNLRYERLKRLYKAGHWKIVAKHLWNMPCKDKIICMDIRLQQFVQMPGNPPKGITGWTKLGGPHPAGMDWDFRPPAQHCLF